MLKGHSTVFRLLRNLHSEPFRVAYLKIYATEQNNTTSAWQMTIRSMHKSSLIHTDTNDWEAILNYMAVAESTHKILHFHNTIFKLETL